VLDFGLCSLRLLPEEKQTLRFDDTNLLLGAAFYEASASTNSSFDDQKSILKHKQQLVSGLFLK